MWLQRFTFKLVNISKFDKLWTFSNCLFYIKLEEDIIMITFLSEQLYYELSSVHLYHLDKSILSWMSTIVTLLKSSGLALQTQSNLTWNMSWTIDPRHALDKFQFLTKTWHPSACINTLQNIHTGQFICILFIWTFLHLFWSLNKKLA